VRIQSVTRKTHALQRPLLAVLLMVLAAYATDRIQAACNAKLQSPPNQRANTAIAPLSEPPHGPASRPVAVKNQNKPVTLIGVPESDEHLLALAAPIAAKIRQRNQTPILLALASANAAQQNLLKQLAPLAGSCIVLTPDSDPPLAEVRALFATNIVSAFRDPEEGSRNAGSQIGLLLAGSFWKKTDVVVAAGAADPEALILGGTLAAHLGVPLIPATGRTNPEGSREAGSHTLSEQMKLLGVQRILHVASDTDLDAKFISGFEHKTEFIDIAGVHKRIIEAIGASRIRNIILFRVPDDSKDDAASAWLTPYLSLMRGAAVVPCHSADAWAAEEDAKKLIRTYSLRPQTVTILAHYDAIGTAKWVEETESGDYEIIAEPCSRPLEGAAVEMGVWPDSIPRAVGRFHTSGADDGQGAYSQSKKGKGAYDSQPGFDLWCLAALRDHEPGDRQRV